MNRRIGALGAIAVLVVLALGISNASAASLSVTAGKLGTFAAPNRCATEPLSVTVAGTSTGGNYTQVSISSVPALCANLKIQLTLVGASIVEFLGAVPAITAPTTVTLTLPALANYSGAAVLGAALTIGGYGVTTTWTAPPAAATCVVSKVKGGGWDPPTTQTCSVTSSSVVTVQGLPPSRSATIKIVIKNNSSDTIRWQVDVNLAQLLNWSTNSITFPGGGGSSCTIVNSAVTLSGSNSGLDSGSSTTVTFDAFESPNTGTKCHV